MSQISFYICFLLHLCCVLSCLERNIIRPKTFIQTHNPDVCQKVFISKFFWPRYKLLEPDLFSVYVVKVFSVSGLVRRGGGFWGSRCCNGVQRWWHLLKSQRDPLGLFLWGPSLGTSMGPPSMRTFFGGCSNNSSWGFLWLKLCCSWAHHGGFLSICGGTSKLEVCWQVLFRARWLILLLLSLISQSFEAVVREQTDSDRL